MLANSIHSRTTRWFIISALVVIAALAAVVAGQGNGFATHPGTTVLVDSADGTGDGGGCGDVANPCNDILTAVAHANAGDTLSVAAGTYTTGAQVFIDKDLSLVGDGPGSTIITPGFDTASSGDGRGWFLVDTGVVFNISDVTLDGSGNLVWQAIRHKGSGGTISNVNFTEIKFNESGPSYSGLGAAIFGDGPVDVLNSTFSEIGRVGVLFFGPGVAGSTYAGNTYTGKGSGDFLDYGVEVGAGAVVTIDGNSISNNQGVANSDGSTSAGILVTTFFGGGSSATITCNSIGSNTTGIAVGFDGSDTSSVAANLNNIVGNSFGVSSTAPLVNAENNYWGSADGPSGAGPGSGDQVTANVDFDPFLQTAVDSNCEPGSGGEPLAVGGVAGLLDGDDVSVAPSQPSSSSSATETLLIAVAAIVVAGIVMVPGGLYARKRWLK